MLQTANSRCTVVIPSADLTFWRRAGHASQTRDIAPPLSTMDSMGDQHHAYTEVWHTLALSFTCSKAKAWGISEIRRHQQETIDSYNTQRKDFK